MGARHKLASIDTGGDNDKGDADREGDDHNGHISSAEDFPEFALEEIALCLSVTEAQRLMPRVCWRWNDAFRNNAFLSCRRILFQEFGWVSTHTLPRSLLSWEDWIQILRLLVDDGSFTTPGSASNRTENRIVRRGWYPRWMFIPQVFFNPRRSLHNGVAVLPDDFRFRFASSYSSPAYLVDLQRVIESLRNDLSNDLVSLFSRDNNFDRESRRRMMIEKVIMLRNLASEQIELEVVRSRYAEIQSIRQAKERDLSYRREQTSRARIELLQVRNDLECAVRGDCGRFVNPAEALSVADDKILSLIPARDMCGNDKARCKELRGLCRSLVATLERRMSRNIISVLMAPPNSSNRPPILALATKGKRKRVARLAAVESELEEIKHFTIARIEALLDENADLLHKSGPEANVRIQIESSLFDIAHWRK